MNWDKHLDHSKRTQVETELKAAHAETSGEIIPVVALRSARRGHCFWLASALSLALSEAILAAWPSPESASWKALAGLLAALAALGLGWLLSRSAGVRRLLTPRADQLESVHRAAEAAFHSLALHRHPAEAGVLLYVSLEERRAVVLAGAGIHGRVGASDWEEACNLLTRAAGKGALDEGLKAAIRHAGRLLAQHHPRRKDDPAEQTGRLHLWGGSV